MRYEAIETQYWQDRDFENLSIKSRYLYLWCLTNDHSHGTTGVYQLPRNKILEIETGMKQEEIQEAWQELEGAGKVLISDGWIWVKGKAKRWVNHSPNVDRSIRLRLKEMPEIIRSKFLEKYPEFKQIQKGDNTIAKSVDNKSKNIEGARQGLARCWQGASNTSDNEQSTNIEGAYKGLTRGLQAPVKLNSNETQTKLNSNETNKQTNGNCLPALTEEIGEENSEEKDGKTDSRKSDDLPFDSNSEAIAEFREQIESRLDRIGWSPNATLSRSEVVENLTVARNALDQVEAMIRSGKRVDNPGGMFVKLFRDLLGAPAAGQIRNELTAEQRVRNQRHLMDAAQKRHQQMLEQYDDMRVDEKLSGLSREQLNYLRDELKNKINHCGDWNPDPMTDKQCRYEIVMYLWNEIKAMKIEV